MTPSQQTPEAKTLRDEVREVVKYESSCCCSYCVSQIEKVDELIAIFDRRLAEVANGCLEAVPDDIAEEISANYDINLIEYPGWVAARKALLAYFRSKGVEVNE
jgi:hypothetical protein